MFDLVVFDCDGVLVDSEVLAGEALRAVHRAHGIEVSAALFSTIVGMKAADGLATLAAATGRALPPRAEADLWPATAALFRERLRPCPGVADLLEGSRLARCVASSSHPERIAFSLEVAGLRRFFGPDALFSAAEVERGKPAPDLFLHAAARMGARPGRCVVIEDTRFGITAAKAAGMTAVGYVGGSHAGPDAAGRLERAGADWVSASMAEIAARLGAA
ncbi:HAD family phosphatase [Aureimonas flava]|uniref:HAD family phosphatase n=1 Tax=Aureimonas flava TaxID=2320271 RepID=A0A3A1WIK6_9HYPH|nr:HAD family phosphatase [Aureimonas flava]RIY00803.1 HAD family phosphatase [Aureimonas flava]